MGCKWACLCSGSCGDCRQYQKEIYFGEAEDILSQSMGYRDYDDHMVHLREQRDDRRQ